MEHRQHICIVGCGYIGVASAIGLSELGHSVVGFDLMRERICALAAGVPPYHEEGLAVRLEQQVRSGSLRFVDSLKAAVRDADFIVVSVGTPARPNGSSDLSALEIAIADLSDLAIGGATVVIRSTVPCGTTDRLSRHLAQKATVIYAPEFLREGHALDDFLSPDRIVIGADCDAVAERYASLFKTLSRPVVKVGFREAELIKSFSNAFLAMKISFANEVATFCEAVDAEALPVLEAVGLDRRIGSHFLEPGIGFGGPCFEKDLCSLQHQALNAHAPAELVNATLRVNERQTRHIVDVLENELGGLNGAHIAVWGLTFKAGTDDVRDSLAVRMIDDLRRRGATVSAYDPAIRGAHPMIRCDVVQSPLEAARGADGLLVLTEWPEFRSVDPREIAKLLGHRVVVDGRNVLDAARLAEHGLRYRGVGRPPSGATHYGDLDAATAV